MVSAWGRGVLLAVLAKHRPKGLLKGGDLLKRGSTNSELDS